MGFFAAAAPYLVQIGVALVSHLLRDDDDRERSKSQRDPNEIETSGQNDYDLLFVIGERRIRARIFYLEVEEYVVTAGPHFSAQKPGKGRRLHVGVVFSQDRTEGVSVIGVDDDTYTATGSPPNNLEELQWTAENPTADGGIVITGTTRRRGKWRMTFNHLADGSQGETLRAAAARAVAQRATNLSFGEDSKGYGISWAHMEFDQPPFGDIPGVEVLAGEPFQILWDEDRDGPNVELVIRGKHLKVPTRGMAYADWPEEWTRNWGAASFWRVHRFEGVPLRNINQASFIEATEISDTEIEIDSEDDVCNVRFAYLATANTNRPTQLNGNAWPPPAPGHPTREAAVAASGIARPVLWYALSFRIDGSWIRWGAWLSLGRVGASGATSRALKFASTRSTGTTSAGLQSVQLAIELPEVVISAFGGDGPDIDPDIDIDGDDDDGIDDEDEDDDGDTSGPFPPGVNPGDPEDIYCPQFDRDKNLRLYEVDAVVSSDDAIDRVEAEMNFAGAGAVVSDGGILHAMPGWDRDPVAHLDATDEDVRRLSFQSSPRLSDRINAASIRLANSRVHHHKPYTTPQIIDSAQRAEDGKLIHRSFGTKGMVTSPTGAGLILRQELRKARPWKVAVYRFPIEYSRELRRAIPGQRIIVNDPEVDLNPVLRRNTSNPLFRYGDATGRYMRLLGRGFNFDDDMTMTIVVIEHPNGVSAPRMEFPNLEPDPSVPGVFVGKPTGLALQEEVFVTGDGTVSSRVVGSSDLAAAAKRIVQWRPVVPGGIPGETYQTLTVQDGSGNEVTLTATPAWGGHRQREIGGSDFEITAVRIGVTYEVRLIDESRAGIQSEASDSSQITLRGARDAPEAIPGLEGFPAPDGYWLNWDPLTSPLVKHVEIWDKAGAAGNPADDVTIDNTWTRRGIATGTEFRRADVADADLDTALRVAIRAVSLSDVVGSAREIGVTPVRLGTGFRWRGAWAVGAEYVLNDVVANDGRAWLCTVAHTAAAGNEPTESNSGGANWDLYTDRGDDGDPGETGQAFSITRATRVAAAVPAAGEWRVNATGTAWGMTDTLRFGGITDAEEAWLRRLGPGALVTAWHSNGAFCDYQTTGAIGFTGSGAARVAAVQVTRIRPYGNLPALGSALTFRFTAAGEDGEPGLTSFGDVLSRATRVSSTSPGDGEWQLSGVGTSGWPVNTNLRIGNVTAAERARLERATGASIVGIRGTAGNWADYILGTATFSATNVATIPLTRIRQLGDTPGIGAAMEFHFTPAGADGSDGDGLPESVYAVYTEEAIPASKLPSNAWGFDQPGTSDGLTWYDEAQSLDPGEILFEAQRDVVGKPSIGDAVADLWSTPKRIGRNAVDGRPGFPGSANSISRAIRIAAGAPGTNEWRDNGTGTNWPAATTLRIGAITDAEKERLERVGAGGLFVMFADASNWADFGVGTVAFTGSGATRSATVTLTQLEAFGEVPAVGAAAMEFRFTPAGEDGLSVNWRQQWLLGEVYTALDAVFNDSRSWICGTEQHLSTAANEPTKANDGGPHWSLMADRGEDGRGVEDVWLINDSEDEPTIPAGSNVWPFDQPVSPFIDTQEGQSAANPVAHLFRRGVPGTPAVGTVPPADAAARAGAGWTDFLYIGKTRWGEDGRDGHGAEDIYAVYPEEILPVSKRPSNAWGFDEPATIDGLEWFDDRHQPTLDATNKVLLKATRRYGGEQDSLPAVGDEVADPWSVPVVDGRYGEDGEDGPGAVTNLVGSATSLPDFIGGLDVQSNVINITFTPSSDAEGHEITYLILGGAAASIRRIDATVTFNNVDLISDPGASSVLVTVRSYRTVDGKRLTSTTATTITITASTGTLSQPSYTSQTAGDGENSINWGNVANATGYDVQRRVVGGSWAALATPSVSQYTDTTAVNGTSYQYRVRATAAGYTVSVWAVSNTLTPTAVALPLLNAPTPSVSVDDLTATFSWSAVAGRQSYRVYVNGGLHATTTGLSATFTGAAGGHSVYLRVVNQDGAEGPQGTAVPFTLTEPPSTPADAGYQYIVGAITTGTQFPTAIRRRFDGTSWGDWAAVDVSTVPGYHFTTSDLDETAIETNGVVGRWIAAPANGPSGLFSRGLHGTRNGRMGIREDYPNAGRYVRLTSNLSWASSLGNSQLHTTLTATGSPHTGSLDSIRGATANYGFYTGSLPSGYDFDGTGGWVRWEPD